MKELNVMSLALLSGYPHWGPILRISRSMLSLNLQTDGALGSPDSNAIKLAYEVMQSLIPSLPYGISPKGRERLTHQDKCLKLIALLQNPTDYTYMRGRNAIVQKSDTNMCIMNLPPIF